VRATDVDWWANLPVSQELLKRISALGPKTGAGVGQGGCADSSLYDRLISVNLKPLNLGPRFALYRSGDRLRDVLGRLGGALPEDSRSESRQPLSRRVRVGRYALANHFTARSVLQNNWRV
jgi:hypothetical protein